MPDTTTVPVQPPPETVVVSETVTVFPPPPEPAPEPPPPPPPPPEPSDVPEQVLGEAELRELLNGLNSVNTALEGGTEVPAQITLDPMQFGAIGVALALVLALLAFLAVVAMRR